MSLPLQLRGMIPLFESQVVAELPNFLKIRKYVLLGNWPDQFNHGTRKSVPNRK
jgi:hypothetical protein